VTSSPTPAKSFAAAALTLALAVAFAEVYARLGAVIGEIWLAAALVHSALGLFVLGLYARRGEARALLSTATLRSDAPAFLAGAPWRAYLPAALILIGTMLLVLVSRQIGRPTTRGGIATNVAWIVWIPVVEELVFRAGLGSAFRRWLGGLWGAWFGATLFALVHAAPTVAHLIEGRLGLPIGPFLLGLGCELLFAATGRLGPVVALHAACNATVVVFALGDDRWLDWLGFLYG
jgi:membrane protease YdiL (CAAX protease family)